MFPTTTLLNFFTFFLGRSPNTTPAEYIQYRFERAAESFKRRLEEGRLPWCRKKNVIETLILTRRTTMRETLFSNRRFRGLVQVGFLPQDDRTRRRVASCVWKIVYSVF